MAEMNILLAKTNAANVMQAYRDRQAKLAEIAAKKELVSMSTAIDTAAGKGNNKLVYRLSGSITRLTGEYLTNAIAIIEADIAAAGYEVVKDAKGTTYTFVWVEDPAEEQEPTDDPGQSDNPGPETPAQPTYTAVTPEQIAALEEGEGPVSKGWYEVDAENEGQYVLSDDETVVENTTYYIKSQE